MRAVICCVLAVGLLLPSLAECAYQGMVTSSTGERRSGQAEIACSDSGPVSLRDGGDTGRVVMSSDDSFWLKVLKIVIRAVRDGVIYETVKWVVKRSWERPPAPVTSPGWSETGCGMGAGGGSRY